MVKRYYLQALIAVGMFAIVFFIGQINYEIREEIQNMGPIGISGEIKRNLLAFILGLLIEWNGLKEILKLNIKVNCLIIPAVILAVIGFIPSFKVMQWFGVGWRGLKDGTVNILMIPESHVVIMVLAGVLLIRSLTPVPSYKHHRDNSE